MAATERVKAMEIACVFSPDDYQKYAQKVGHPDGELAKGFQYSGSYCGRNIEKIYEKAVAHGVVPSLKDAVSAFQQASHAVIFTGFFVLHQKGAEGPKGALGGCETDGPLGALAVLRALCARGVYVSLFCDVHNGPVIQKAYDTMMKFFEETDPGFWQCLQTFSRCLNFVTAENVMESEKKQEVFGTEILSPLEERSLCTAMELRKALEKAWGSTLCPVDTLFALERLGAPYRNIRGRDIGEHTEPIDCLYPLVEGGINEETRAQLAKIPITALRAVAHVTADACSIAVGDGGNEVGMGKVVSVPGVGELSPGGEFAALAVNGCVRTCDSAVLGTVSNWAGSAIEAACHVMWPPKTEYVQSMRSDGSSLEFLLLQAIMAKPTLAVDGSHNDRQLSVDGLSFDPHHREFYDYLWHLADVTTIRDAKRQRVKLLLDDGDWLEWLGGWLCLPILSILALMIYLSLCTIRWRRVRQSACCCARKTTTPNLGGSVSAAFTTVLAFILSLLAVTQAIYLLGASKDLSEVLCSTDRILLGYCDYYLRRS
eukprot:symbB.v1.2.019446.t2/scaffold1552.1/size220100/4